MNKSHTTHYPPAIVLGCHKLALGVIRSLGRQKIPVIGVYYNENDMGFVSKYVFKRFKSPNPDLEETRFIDFLLKLAKQYNDGLIIPSDDPTLMAVSRHKDEIEPYCKVSCRDWQTIEKLLEKKYTYRIAEQIGVPAPQTLVTDDMEKASGFIKKIGYPFILKPSLGHQFFNAFKTKMIIIEDHAAFIEKQAVADKHRIEMMIQELIPGDDTSGVNYNSYFIDQNHCIEFTAQKKRLSPRKIGFPCVLISKDIPEIADYGRRMLQAIDFRGFSCMEFKKDARDNTYKLMEINARQNLSSSLAVCCGIDFPYLTYMYELFGILPDYQANFKKNVHWIDVERDFKEWILNRNNESLGFKDYLDPYLQEHIFCMFSLTDPKPAFKRVRDAVKLLF